MKTTFQKQQFLAGCRAGIPVVLGYIPVGIAYGLLGRQAGLSIGGTCGMSIMVFAGASEMMAAGMYGQGAGMAAIILTTFILNLRHLIMSTCVMNRLRGGSTAAKLLAAFGVTDESFAIFTTEKEDHCTIPFFLGLILVTYLSWNVGTFIGAVTSSLLPEILTASLGIALYAMFIGLLFPNLNGNWKLDVLVVLTALVNTLLTRFMDSSWALILSTLLCAFIGIFFVDLNDESREEDSHGRN